MRLDVDSEMALLRFLRDAEGAGVFDWTANSSDGASDKTDGMTKLLTTWYHLDKLGFSHNDIRTGMRATVGGSLSSALSWLCLHLDSRRLPLGFTDKTDIEEVQAATTLSFQAAQRTATKTSAKIQDSDEPHRTNVVEAPKEEAPTTTNSAIDSKLKAQILAMSQTEQEVEYSSENEEEDISELPLHVQHARITMDLDAVKYLVASTADTASKRKLAGKIKELSAQIKAIEKTHGFDRRKAEVEFARAARTRPTPSSAGIQSSRLAVASSDPPILQTVPPPTPPPAPAPETSAKKEEDDETIDLGQLLDISATSAGPSSEEPTVSISSHLRSRNITIPTSWTGKFPKVVLHEQCIKAAPGGGKTVKIRYETIQDGRAMFRAKVEIKGLPSEDGEDIGPRIFTLHKEDWVEKAKPAEELVATLALRTLFSHMPLYRTLPPEYRDFWIALDDEQRAEQDRARRSEEEGVWSFVKELMEEKQQARLTSNRSQNRISSKDGISSNNEVARVQRTGAFTHSLAIHASLKSSLVRRRQSKIYQSLLASRKSLPVFAMRDELVKALTDQCVTVISGETGSGKSTQIPQFILEHAIDDEGLGGTCTVLCAQPRRISAVSLAARVSLELGDGEDRVGKDGSWVGHVVRLESKISESSTRLTYLTTGVLLRRLEADPLLTGITWVVVDEVHERSLESDFLLIVLRRVVKARLMLWMKGLAQGSGNAENLSPPLRVVLMSATAEAEKFARYFQGALDDISSDAARAGISLSCPVVTVPGRTYPVKTFFLEDAVEKSGYHMEPGSEFAKRSDLISKAGVIKVGGRSGKSGTTVHYELSSDANAIRHEPRPKVAAASVEGDDAAESPLFDNNDDDGFDAEDDSGFSNGVSAATIQTLERMDKRRIDLDLLEHLIRHLVRTEDASIPEEKSFTGSILVFLPGIAEIRRLYDRLTAEGLRSNQFGPGLWVLPLHSMLGGSDQSRVFQPAPTGKRKVVLATNIAETGITIPDVVYVIDTCRAREVSYDAKRNMTKLSEVLVSQANCRQRAGRAGRVRPGVCYHLISRATYGRMPPHRPPEMLRLPLEELVLRSLASVPLNDVKVDVREMLGEAIDPPPAKNVEKSVSLLMQIEALTPNGNLTSLGYQLASLPLDARLGKMLLYAISLECLDPILTIAASLSIAKGPFASSFEDTGSISRNSIAKKFKTGDSDLLVIANAFAAWRNCLTKPVGGHKAMLAFAAENNLSIPNLIQIEEGRAQLLRVLVSAKVLPSWVLAGDPDHSKTYQSNLLQTDIPVNPFSRNASSPTVLLAALAAGLYPSLLVMDETQPKPTRPGKLQLHFPGKKDLFVHVHPRSVLADLAERLAPGWYVTHAMTKTEGHRGAPERITASDLSRIGNGFVVVAAGVGSVSVEHRMGLLTVDDGRIAIKCPPRTASLVALFLSIVRVAIDSRMSQDEDVYMGVLRERKVEHSRMIRSLSQEWRDKALALFYAILNKERLC
ncbi:P-loop containing nucleoside triphosphate hydrolase protein [Zopfochytrium polystomum]|nr:P-loop containing nucleoside triphosphate hydrolase protein [Zopfochytrium polystomum]